MKDINQFDIENNIPLVSSVQENWLNELLYIAGPCTVESVDQLFKIVEPLKSAGITHIRGGAYKPLTFPYRNDNMYELREEGLTMLNIVKREFDVNIVTEVVDTRTLQSVQQVADIIQIGSRNMYNYTLLEAVALTGKPIILKRHFGASLRDWLGAAEYLLSNGNDKVILCERGISVPHTHEVTSRFIADIQVIPMVKRYTKLPIIIDPSHATFNREIVRDITYAGVAAGADGVLIEAHHTPEEAVVDRLNAVSIPKCIEIYNKSLELRSIL
jgi:3-deoxy-7-phosphoheptulonate synthase